MSELSRDPPRLTIADRLFGISWGFVILLCLLVGVGVLALYSAASGDMDPWASRHIVRFGVTLSGMLIIAMIDVRLWFRLAYVGYFVTLGLLMSVEVMGSIGMGAQRWISLGPIQLQPSELMKIALVLALSRYFHRIGPEEIGRPTTLILPLLMIFTPVALVLKQPDLGTALILVMIGGAMFFLAGVRLWKFAIVGLAGVSAVPIAWQFLHDYQKNRVLTFLEPERDPLGTGYHIMQSKIALGSGGLSGKGFLEGTQSHLNFLPEKQTDFIFTLFAEEWGMLGAIVLLFLYALVIAYGAVVALRCQNQFGRLLAVGISTNLFFYVFINIAMVMGLLPVVGVPLPLISYGGTAMLAVMCGFGLMLSANVGRDLRIPRRGDPSGGF